MNTSNRSFLQHLLKQQSSEPTKVAIEVVEEVKVKTDKECDPGLEAMKIAFEARATTHYWHLQTTSQATHDVLGKFYTSLVEEIDEFLEGFIGAYGRFRGNVELEIKSLPGEEAPILYMEELYTKFMKIYENSKVQIRPHLAHSIREILELIGKTAYQLTQS